MARIMLVEDDPDVRAMLLDYLGTLGHDVEASADGAEMDARLAAGHVPDLLIIDVGLPGKDGFTIARELRVRMDPGILMLTGAADLVDRVVGLEAGADDYLAKPVALPELAARIEAVLRRRRPPGQGSVPFGAYSLDLKAFVLVDPSGRALDLSPMEIDLVAAFATNPGKVLSREDLIRRAPPRGEESLDRSIDHRVARLRRKLEPDPTRPRLIKTVRGGGYLYPR